MGQVMPLGLTSYMGPLPHLRVSLQRGEGWPEVSLNELPLQGRKQDSAIKLCPSILHLRFHIRLSDLFGI